MNNADGHQLDSEGMAGRLLLVVDALVPTAVHQACAELAARLADQSGLPVTGAPAQVARPRPPPPPPPPPLPVPAATAQVARLDAIRDSIGRDNDARRREYAPVPRPAQAMSSAPFLWRGHRAPARER